MKAVGTYAIDSWAETAFEEAPAPEGPRLVRTEAATTWSGDVVGTAHVAYLMSVRADKTATFVGFERVTGQLAGREGTIVLRSEGTFDGQTVIGAWAIVAGTGTGGLRDLAGGGTFVAALGEPATFELTYELPPERRP